MRPSYDFEFPPEQDRALRRARRLAWTTIVYLVSVVLTMSISARPSSRSPAMNRTCSKSLKMRCATAAPSTGGCTTWRWSR